MEVYAVFFLSPQEKQKPDVQNTVPFKLQITLYLYYRTYRIVAYNAFRSESQATFKSKNEKKKNDEIFTFKVI